MDGDEDYVRVQVLTNKGALDRDKQLAVVEQLTDLVATAAGDSSLKTRTWVLLTEAEDGGWGLWGHAHTNDELVKAAQAIAGLEAAEPSRESPGPVRRIAPKPIGFTLQGPSVRFAPCGAGTDPMS